MFSYKPLMRTLVDKGMNKTQLRIATGMSMNTLAKLSKNEYVSMTVLDSICRVLGCKIEDVIEYVDYEKIEGNEKSEEDEEELFI